jgi:5'-nucleotidase
MAAFNSKLFLSANKEDVSRAVRAGYPAGHIMSVAQAVDDNDSSIRIAFDFDGVLADDSSEKVFQANGDIKAFQQHEVSHADLPVPPGPLKPLLEGISAVQELEECLQAEGDYQPRLRTAIITARNASSHKRVIKTLRAWGIEVNEAFFLGGVDKSEILKNFKPHIYFDDQIGHLNQSKDFVPSVHIPFGVTNI